VKFESQLQLQAYLDGEMPEAQRREVEAWLAWDPEARALLNELRQTDAALAVGDCDLKLPESREFYWSKIQREIRRLETADSVPDRSGVWHWLTLWRRWLVPVGGLAILTVALIWGAWFSGRPNSLEVVLTSGNGTTYRDQARGMTLVWLSFPAENRFPEDELDALLFY